MNIKTRYTLFFFLYLLAFSLSMLNAQNIPALSSDSTSITLDTIQPIVTDTSFVNADSSLVLKDTSIIQLESTQSSLDQVSLSGDSIDAPIEYFGKDTMWFDIENKQAHLYGDAYVKQKDLSLTADYIIFDWVNNMVTAEFTRDSSGNIKGLPEFKDGSQQFTARKMRFNFKTKKGIIYDARTTQNDLYVLSDKGRFESANEADSTSTDVLYAANAGFTTCNHPVPHYILQSKKQKVIPDKVAIVGPTNLEIAGVPTPIWLPFGFFPLKQDKHTGLLFGDYEISDNLGLGFRSIGWYFPISDRMDLSVTGDVFTRGTWGIRASSNFKKRYKYNGNISVEYYDQKLEDAMAQVNSEKSFKINGRLNQESNAHPTIQLGGRIDIETNGFGKRNENDAQNVLRNELGSQVTFSKTFPRRPFTFSTSFTHSQVVSTKELIINFPNFNLRTKQIYPFKSKKKKPKESWYEKINMTYIAEAQNRFTTTDTTLFTQKTLDDAQFGAKQNISTGATYRLLKYFNVTPSANYTEISYFKTTSKVLNPELLIEIDTTTDSNGIDFYERDTTFGEIEEMEDFGFKALRQYKAGIDITTVLFGTVQFKKGFLRGLRHTMKPRLGFNYTPDYTNPDLGYFEEVETDIRPSERDTITYSIFENGIYRTPSTAGKKMALTYGIGNNFDGKYYSKKDSTSKKFKLFNSVSVNGDYNFAADSLNFSPLTINGNTSFLKNIIRFNFNMSYDFYKLNEEGKQIEKFYWQEQPGKLLRFTRGGFTINTGLSVSKIKDLFKKKESKESKDDKAKSGKKTLSLEESLLDLFENFTVTHIFKVDFTPVNNRDTIRIGTNNLSLRGNIKLTKNWSINVGQIGYNFKTKKVTYPDFGFQRDLHCWEMGMDWQPTKGTYSFFIRVKPSMLDFIKVPYSKNNVDSFGGF